MRMFKNYKPLEFFSIIAAVLFVIGMIFFIPVLIHFLEVGTVNKLPTLIVSGFVIMTAIICWFSGIILSTLVNQHKQDFEFQQAFEFFQFNDYIVIFLLQTEKIVTVIYFAYHLRRMRCDDKLNVRKSTF